jgi:predicted RNA-binding protein with TRAM domain
MVEYPVQKGDKITADCSSVGSKGDGMCKYQGLVIFVKDAIIGKRYDIMITNVQPKVAFGEIIREVI